VRGEEGGQGRPCPPRLVAEHRFDDTAAELDDLIRDAALDTSTRVSAVATLADECARGLRAWDDFVDIVPLDDALVAPIATERLSALSPLDVGDLLRLLRSTTHFWVKAELISPLITVGVPSSQILDTATSTSARRPCLVIGSCATAPWS